VEALLLDLLAHPHCSLREAAGDAYKRTLSSRHTPFVRFAVKGCM
jgi:hypothetical protein